MTPGDPTCVQPYNLSTCGICAWHLGTPHLALMTVRPKRFDLETMRPTSILSQRDSRPARGLCKSVHCKKKLMGNSISCCDGADPNYRVDGIFCQQPSRTLPIHVMVMSEFPKVSVIHIRIISSHFVIHVGKILLFIIHIGKILLDHHPCRKSLSMLEKFIIYVGKPFGKNLSLTHTRHLHSLKKMKICHHSG